MSTTVAPMSSMLLHNNHMSWKDRIVLAQHQQQQQQDDSSFSSLSSSNGTKGCITRPQQCISQQGQGQIHQQQSKKLESCPRPRSSMLLVVFPDAPTRKWPTVDKKKWGHEQPHQPQQNGRKLRFLSTTMTKVDEPQHRDSVSGMILDDDYYYDDDMEHDEYSYYHRKAAGASSRFNGLRLRPDEQKRKQMIVQKKNLQRRQQHQ
ncbi:hypothetical protein ACA910_011868 [Epithemia clementina (nom. ined.)]